MQKATRADLEPVYKIGYRAGNWRPASAFYPRRPECAPSFLPRTEAATPIRFAGAFGAIAAGPIARQRKVTP